MPYDVYAKADGRNRQYRRGGYLFFTDEPVRLEDEQVTEELRSDPWLFLVPVEVSVEVPPADAGSDEQKRSETKTGGAE